MDNYKVTGICCVCGNTYTHWGNNPWPLKNKKGEDFGENDRCCNECNANIVIPARIQQMINKENKEDK